jgi:hypothetical protein
VIAAGAPVPAAAGGPRRRNFFHALRPVAIRGVITEADKNYWAFKPIAHPAPPAVE